MKIKPLWDYVLIETIKADDKTPGGLILPDTSKSPPQVGKILEVGPGSYRDGKWTPTSVQKGQKVLFSHYTGHSLKDMLATLSTAPIYEGQLLIHETDILCTVED